MTRWVLQFKIPYFSPKTRWNFDLIYLDMKSQLENFLKTKQKQIILRAIERVVEIIPFSSFSSVKYRILKHCGAFSLCLLKWKQKTNSTLKIRISDSCKQEIFGIKNQVLCFQGHPEFNLSILEGCRKTKAKMEKKEIIRSIDNPTPNPSVTGFEKICYEFMHY